MEPGVKAAIDELLTRAGRRGFVTMAEIQQELEEAEAPGSAFDEAMEAVRERGLAVREDGDNDFDSLHIDQGAIGLSDPVSMYLRQIGRVPLLTPQQEVELAMALEAGRLAGTQLSQSGTKAKPGPEDDTARLIRTMRNGERAEKRLVEANLRLVVSIAKRYVGNGMPLLDLIQEGNLGLMKAVEKFDYRKGYRFSTYATWWIRQAVSRALADQSRTIRVPVHLVETIYNVSKAQRRLFQELGREPTVEEIAHEIELTPGRVRELSRISQGTVSLETPVSDKGESTLGDFVPDKAAEVAMEGAAFKLLQEYVALALEELTERERQIILMRFGLEDGRVRTLGELSTHFDVTRERIRQLETRALYKLRRKSEGRRLESYLRDG
ncbi:MAG: sigma-70 family RNA polymerase sigma factor [bacterium]|nr:sigma-70 family RNA polymerase sigma factor [bacterium]MDE0289843.1 sigma-70 family RNA polymerase sigma factor [bacterium]MDE0440272.1 sigma-70 family RNA polymerase sigma factor [bacterium]